ncbi:MAG: glutathione S-transferase [Methylococcaceae bacterium]|nr:glutathione S-transferase [Methylococcaceae bacterium]
MIINPQKIVSTPILYSFRRCPYAMRARMALKYAGVSVYLREVELRNKPAALLQYSPKGTVPVIVFSDGSVIDESRDIMLWALSINDPEQWLPKQADLCAQINWLLDKNDFEFKAILDKYKYPDRYPEKTALEYRAFGEQFLMLLEARLSQHWFLVSDTVSMADIGIFPFIRQFAEVDRAWFEQANYPYLQAWLDYFLRSDIFTSMMQKYVPWTENAEPILFP